MVSINIGNLGGVWVALALLAMIFLGAGIVLFSVASTAPADWQPAITEAAWGFTKFGLIPFVILVIAGILFILSNG